jgi:hypothetical protein
MILVFSEPGNQHARTFAARFPSADVRMLTCEDLSNEGWEIDQSNFEYSRICLGGTAYQVGEISGLISLSPAIQQQELLHIREDDRLYVATEMNAFLTFFFSRLTCPMVNRPVLGNFLGTSWRQEHWIQNAAECGLPVIPFCRQTKQPYQYAYIIPPSGSIFNVSVLNGRVLEPYRYELHPACLRLADKAGLNWVQFQFFHYNGQLLFQGANPRPAIEDPNLAAAIIQFFPLQQITML